MSKKLPPIEERMQELFDVLDNLVIASFEHGYQSVFNSDAANARKNGVELLLTKARAEAIALAVRIK